MLCLKHQAVGSYTGRGIKLHAFCKGRWDARFTLKSKVFLGKPVICWSLYGFLISLSMRAASSAYPVFVKISARWTLKIEIIIIIIFFFLLLPNLFYVVCVVFIFHVFVLFCVVFVFWGLLFKLPLVRLILSFSKYLLNWTELNWIDFLPTFPSY